MLLFFKPMLGFVAKEALFVNFQFLLVANKFQYGIQAEIYIHDRFGSICFSKFELIDKISVTEWLVPLVRINCLRSDWM